MKNSYENWIPITVSYTHISVFITKSSMCLIQGIEKHTEETVSIVLLFFFFPQKLFLEEENTVCLKTVLQGKIHFILQHCLTINIR